MYKNFLYQKEAHIAILTFNRPEALNALNQATLIELNNILSEIANDDELYVIIVTGAGKAFVAGADISEMQPLNATEAIAFSKLGQSVFRKLEKLSKVTIAAVNGYALGGGLELAMSCDLRYASEKAKFGQPEVSLGITPGFAGTQRLAALVNPARAKEYIFTGRMILAGEAKSVGLVNDVAQDVLAKAKEVAEAIVKQAPIAIKHAKTAIDLGINAPIDDGADIEASLFGLCFTTEDQKNGMQAFLNKTKVAFKNK